LNALSEGIQKGCLSFYNKDKDITLEPVGLIQLEVKVKRSENKTKINLKLGWKENNGEGDKGPLLIEPGS
jgi:amphi-Trp domain-containing protein